MRLRCIWSYLLCVIRSSDGAQSRQVALAWYAFAGRSYRRDGVSRDGAGDIAEALARGEIAAEAVAWSLGFEPEDAFSVGFQGRFRSVTSMSGALDIGTVALGQNSASIEVCDDGLFANLCCNGIEVEIGAKGLLCGTAIGSQESPETTIIPGLSAFRWRSLEFQGRLKTRNSVQEIQGTAYFQQVHSRIPLLPWDWCYCVFSDGSLAGVSTLRLGRDLFASKRYIESDCTSRLNKQIFSRGFFLDGESGRSFRMTRSSVFGSTDVDGKRQVKHIAAHNEDGSRMQFDVVIQDSHAFQFSRGSGVFSNPRFHYRSSLGAVENFRFERAGSVCENRSIDSGHCNLERTFGLML